MQRELINLPRFKFQLNDYKDHLKHLQSVKDSISTDGYSRLHKTYQEKIAELTKQIETLSQAGEEQRFKDELEAHHLQAKQNQLKQELQEMERLYINGVLGEEEYIRERVQIKKRLRHIRKRLSKTQRELSELSFYLNHEGDESYRQVRVSQFLNRVKSKAVLSLSDAGSLSIPKLTGSRTMKDFVQFRKMVSPTIIKFIYMLGALILTVGGIAMLFMGQEKLLIGLGALTAGNLFWRILCEGWILAFRIHDSLVSVEKGLKKQ